MNTTPSFLGIGAQKAGTSWLWHMLNSHPDVWMPVIKEIHYFDHLFVPDNRKWTLNGLKNGVKRELRKEIRKQNINFKFLEYLTAMIESDRYTKQWYEHFFKMAPRNIDVIGEITPEYSIVGEEGIRFIKSYLGSNLKLIYIVRDPYDRAISHLKMNMSRKGLLSASNKVWMENSAKHPILRNGDYRVSMPLWEKYFDLNNILYLPFKKIKLAPEETLCEIESFLNIRAFNKYPDPHKPIHVTKAATVPKPVAQHLSELTHPNKKYIEEKFHPEFLKFI